MATENHLRRVGLSFSSPESYQGKCDEGRRDHARGEKNLRIRVENFCSTPSIKAGHTHSRSETSFMRTDAELVRQAIAGQRAAAGEIYDRYVPMVRAIVRDCTFSDCEVDEVVQEIFLRVLTHLRKLREPDRLAGWIVQIARNQMSDSQRRTISVRQREGPVVEEPIDQRIVPLDDEHQRVHAAIAQLAENERLAVHFFYLCEQPAEVARQSLGLSPSGFYKTIVKARSRLRALLTQQEVK